MVSRCIEGFYYIVKARGEQEKEMWFQFLFGSAWGFAVHGIENLSGSVAVCLPYWERVLQL